MAHNWSGANTTCVLCCSVPCPLQTVCDISPFDASGSLMCCSFHVFLLKCLFDPMYLCAHVSRRQPGHFCYGSRCLSFQVKHDNLTIQGFEPVNEIEQPRSHKLPINLCLVDSDH